MDSIILNKSDPNWSITKQFTLGGNPVDVTGIPLRFQMWAKDTDVFVLSEVCEVIDGPSGLVAFTIPRTLVPGEYCGAFIARLGFFRLTAPEFSFLLINVDVG
jgi:hypothetical protein